MGSTDSSAAPGVLTTGARAAAEGAVVAALIAAGAVRVWSAPSAVRAVEIGVALAWAASAVSVAWLLWARGREMKIFWWAFGGGMALRGGTLVALAAWGYRRETVSLDALLISYAVALIALLLTLEFRHLRVK